MPTADTKIVEESFKEGQKEARASAQLATVKKENETLMKAKQQLERAYRGAVEKPNRMHQVLAVGAGAIGVPIGFKLNEVLERKSAKMVDKETGKKTTAGKVVQHGLIPVGGLGLAVWGAFIENGAVSNAMMGGGVGIAAGSMIRSAFKVPLPVEAEALAP